MDKIRGTKLKMSQIWKENKVVPVTLVKVGVSEVESAGLEEGKVVHVSGFSKGRGFQGVVKRHGFGGGPKTHGQKDRLRAPGSIGNTSPQRVVPGRKMAGRMGNSRVTVRNLLIMAVDKETGILMLKGAVPGANRGKLEIRLSK